MDMRKLESELKGKTMQVYNYLLKERGGSVGVREVQRSLRFSSPSVASYHLDKLVDMGLTEKKYGNYSLKKEVKVGALTDFILLGRFMLPRYFFYAVFFTTMLVTYVLSYPQILSVHNVVAIVFGVLGSIILWYETYRIIKKKLF
jgi:DNA-binding transcriptional ArsR family regulator